MAEEQGALQNTGWKDSHLENLAEWYKAKAKPAWDPLRGGN